MTPEQAQTRALLSILDVVEELALGLAAGQTPEQDWADIVADSFKVHRAELRDPAGHDVAGKPAAPPLDPSNRG